MPRITKKQRVRDFVTAHGWQSVGEAEWNELRAALPDISEATLRDSGLPILPPWGGLAQHSLDELEASLREFTAVYEARPGLHRYCRDQVIAAKDRARWVSLNPRSDDARRKLKAEMVEWMLVWLGDPAMFPAWVELRLRTR